VLGLTLALRSNLLQASSKKAGHGLTAEPRPEPEWMQEQLGV
jgi:hypothetical protein